MWAGLKGCCATALATATVAAAAAGSGQKPFTEPNMLPPKVTGPSDILNSKFDVVKARSMAQASERGAIDRVDLTGRDGSQLNFIGSRIRGDLVVLTPGSTSPRSSNKDSSAQPAKPD